MGDQIWAAGREPFRGSAAILRKASSAQAPHGAAARSNLRASARCAATQTVIGGPGSQPGVVSVYRRAWSKRRVAPTHPPARQRLSRLARTPATSSKRDCDFSSRSRQQPCVCDPKCDARMGRPPLPPRGARSLRLLRRPMFARHFRNCADAHRWKGLVRHAPSQGPRESASNASTAALSRPSRPMVKRDTGLQPRSPRACRPRRWSPGVWPRRARTIGVCGHGGSDPDSLGCAVSSPR
ncbi:hypothetical protein K523DRAFT_165914 [Schizophyllum commune Tattone D]|nr:hypothetical protein K523DRAFT_165914 [Schizophyllum commune Tattone D]